MDKKYFVIQIKDDIWAVKEEGKQTPIAVYPQKEEAIKRGKAAAQLNEAELIIEHGNGVTENFTYTNQPTV